MKYNPFRYIGQILKVCFFYIVFVFWNCFRLFDACHEAKQKSADDSDDWYGRHYSTFQPSFEKMASIIDQTRELQETRYYRVTFVHQTADLVEPSQFWLDYAKFLLSNEGDHFLPRHFHTPTKNLAQVIIKQKPCVYLQFQINLPFPPSKKQIKKNPGEEML